MTGSKMWKVAWPGAGALSCTNPRKKPFRRCCNGVCPSGLTPENQRQFRIADGKDPFRQIIQSQAGRLELLRERVKHRGEVVSRSQTMFAGRAIISASQILIVAQARRSAALGAMANVLRKNA